MRTVPFRFIVVQHNYVRREHTTKSKKARRVDLSRELRSVLADVRDKRLDTNGHLIPGANVSFVDRLDEVPVF